MKTIAMLILFCASVYGADNVNTNTADITTKVYEHDLDGGKGHLRAEKVYRGDKRILTILRTTHGGVTKTSRSCEIGDDIVMIESDDDGDGTFETFSLYRSGTKDMEMFTRQADGSVKPVSARTLKATRKQLATVNDAVEKLFQNEGLTDEQFEKLIEETQKKIQDAEKEKTNDKK